MRLSGVHDALRAVVRLGRRHALEAGVAERLRILVIAAHGGKTLLVVQRHDDAAVPHAQAAERQCFARGHVR
jgi:hypothetical protein